ncbi:MAG: hypothetical protein HC817_05070 [Saprospiraceae bacterium]|nr:hypothetical protein [Saprospiraceae bacterium]
MQERFDADPIDWAWLNKRLNSARDYFSKEFSTILIKIITHKEKMTLLSRAKTYVEELIELDLALYEWYKKFYKSALLVQCVVDDVIITRAIVESALPASHRFELLQNAKNSITSASNFNKNKVEENSESYYSTRLDGSFEGKKKPEKVKKSPKTKSQNGLSDTYSTTFDLQKAGLTPQQIAQKRQLTLPTVYHHFIVLIGRGLLDGHKIISSDRFETIARAFEGLEVGNSIVPAKEILGDDYSYEEIRLVRATQLAEGAS